MKGIVNISHFVKQSLPTFDYINFLAAHLKLILIKASEEHFISTRTSLETRAYQVADDATHKYLMLKRKEVNTTKLC